MPQWRFSMLSHRRGSRCLRERHRMNACGRQPCWSGTSSQVAVAGTRILSWMEDLDDESAARGRVVGAQDRQAELRPAIHRPRTPTGCGRCRARWRTWTTRASISHPAGRPAQRAGCPRSPQALGERFAFPTPPTAFKFSFETQTPERRLRRQRAPSAPSSRRPRRPARSPAGSSRAAA